jgi:hypothetical protein
MPLHLHEIQIPDGADAPNELDRLTIGFKFAVPNLIGGGAGQTVTVVVTGMQLPPAAKYTVLVQPNQDATWFVSAKTTTGFTITLTPRLAANTLAAGTIDIVIIG